MSYKKQSTEAKIYHSHSGEGIVGFGVSGRAAPCQSPLAMSPFIGSRHDSGNCDRQSKPF